MNKDTREIFAVLFSAWMFGSVIFVGPVVLLAWLIYG
jgi:hypothetical protein